jgi:hypothetical protein
MSANESTKRRPKRKRDEPVVAQPPLLPDEVKSLRDFLAFALGRPHLTWYEENFLNSIKHRLYRQAIWLTDKQQAILQQIKDKLHYDRPDIPLPPTDPDGIEENDDPDGWPVVRDLANQFEDDDELLDWLAEA